MTTIYSELPITGRDYVFNSTVGQRSIFEAINDYLARINGDIQAAQSAFIERTTEDFKERYYLPGSGYLQESDGQGGYKNVQASGEWDVAFPLRNLGAQIEMTRIAEGYTTMEELQRHIDTVITQSINSRRYWVLRSLLNNTNQTFEDARRGSLTVKPLANGDSDLYPPVIGSVANATEDHYLESGYAASAISDTNDPYVTIGNDLEEHFGTATGGSDIAVFINNAQTALTRDLAAFVSVTDMGITPGNDTATVNSIPARLQGNASWRILGRHDEAGVWIVEWRHVPANYMIGVHLEAAAPLIQRVHPSFTGLGSGLQLVAEDERYPLKTMVWVDEYGIGAGNRLNGVVMELGTGGTYTIPSGYS